MVQKCILNAKYFLLFPGPLKIAANIVMIFVNLNDIITHAQIKDGTQRMSLPIVFILLLSCRLLIYYQETRREQKELKEKQELEMKKNAAEQRTEQEVNNQTSPEEKKTQ